MLHELYIQLVLTQCSLRRIGLLLLIYFLPAAKRLFNPIDRELKARIFTIHLSLLARIKVMSHPEVIKITAPHWFSPSFDPAKTLY